MVLEARTLKLFALLVCVLLVFETGSCWQKIVVLEAHILEEFAPIAMVLESCSFVPPNPPNVLLVSMMAYKVLELSLFESISLWGYVVVLKDQDFVKLLETSLHARMQP